MCTQQINHGTQTAIVESFRHEKSCFININFLANKKLMLGAFIIIASANLLEDAKIHWTKTI